MEQLDHKKKFKQLYQAKAGKQNMQYRHWRAFGVH